MPSRTTWLLLTPTLALSGLLLAAGVCGAWYVHRVNRDVSNSLAEMVVATQSAERLVLALRDVRINLHRFVQQGETAHIDDARSSLEIARQEIHRQVGFGADTGIGGELMDSWLQSIQGQLESSGNGASARENAIRLLGQLDGQLLAPAERLLETWQASATETSRQNQVTAWRIGLGLLVPGVTGAVAGVLFGFAMARSVHRSLVEITVPVRDIAGRLNEVVGPITVAANTDLSGLDEALRMLADKTSDVVSRLQASQQKTLRREQLAAVGQLAAGLAHELRNPLMSVKLIVQAARERTDPSLSERDLAVMEDELSRLENMLQKVLDFARPPRPERRNVEIRQLIGDTIEFLNPRAGQQAVRIRYSGPPQKLYVDVDGPQIRQVLLNLAINALDAMPDGGDIDIDVAEVRPGKNGGLDSTGRTGIPADMPEVVIRVADSGNGIPAALMDRLFEPFSSSRVTGIGLGLSVSRQIVESHQGTITASNRPDGGAEFQVRLPLCTPTPSPEERSHANVTGH